MKNSLAILLCMILACSDVCGQVDSTKVLHGLRMSPMVGIGFIQNDIKKLNAALKKNGMPVFGSLQPLWAAGFSYFGRRIYGGTDVSYSADVRSNAGVYSDFAFKSVTTYMGYNISRNKDFILMPNIGFDEMINTIDITAAGAPQVSLSIPGNTIRMISFSAGLRFGCFILSSYHSNNMYIDGGLGGGYIFKFYTEPFKSPSGQVFRDVPEVGKNSLYLQGVLFIYFSNFYKPRYP